VELVPNRNSRPAILLREGWREGKKVRKRTLANLTDWPPEQVEALRRVLKGEGLAAPAAALTIERSLPHGHVEAILGTVRALGLERWIAPQRSATRDLVVAMLVARLIDPGSKLATTRSWHTTTVAEELGVGEVDEDALYAAMDWLVARQGPIEAKLAKVHLHEGCLVLYDVSSSDYTGRHCELAHFGHSRDGKPGFPQIVYGLLCNAEGCPVAVEVFEGNTADPATLRVQIEKLTARFGLTRVVLVGDRGMLTEARIDQALKPAGLDWISALRGPAIQRLANEGALQLSLFDEQDLAEITSPAFPGERLIACRNPWLAEERARKREELIRATETLLVKGVAATQRSRRPLRGRAEIGLRVGRILNRYKVGKYFRLSITETTFAYERQQERIARDAAVDGLYVIRTSVPASAMTTSQAVAAYKDLTHVEFAFRSLKGVDLKIRPIHHRRTDRVRAHVFLCMLAYYVEWHMRRLLAPLLFDDDDKASAAALRPSVVAKARRSASATAKAKRKCTPDGLPVHSFPTLLAELGTRTRNRCRFTTNPESPPFLQLAEPTAVQRRALELLGLFPVPTPAKG
jgi:transposase